MRLRWIRKKPRLFTDVLMAAHGQPLFSWGARNLGATGDARSRYIAALKEADQRRFGPLLQFVRS